MKILLIIVHLFFYECTSTPSLKFACHPLDPDLSTILLQKKSHILMQDLPYMKNMRIVSFDSEFTNEEIQIIAESFDLIRLVIHLKEFEEAVNEINILKHKEGDVESDDWCTYSPRFVDCSAVPPDRTITSLTEFLTIIRNIPKKINIRKATGESKTRWRAFAIIAGDDIAWNQHKEFKKINQIKQPNVAKTLFHELLHSFGYHHGTRVPYKIGELILLLHRKYRHTPLVNSTIRGGFVDQLKTHPPDIKFYFE